MAIVTNELWTRGDFVDLARRQRQFLGVMLLLLIANAAIPFVQPAQQPLVRAAATLLSLASLYFVYKLVAAVLPASSTWIIVAYFVLSFVPFVNLLLLVYLNTLATKRLRLTDCPAGFFGAKMSALEALPEDFTVTLTV